MGTKVLGKWVWERDAIVEHRQTTEAKDSHLEFTHFSRSCNTVRKFCFITHYALLGHGLIKLAAPDIIVNNVCNVLFS